MTANNLLPINCEILAITKTTAIENLYRVSFPHVDTVHHGQFLQLSVPGFGECAISITDFSVEEQWLEFLIRKVGLVTNQIFNLNVGDYLPMRGSYGKGFQLANYKGKHLAIVAGGSGLAPVRSLIKHFYNNPQDAKSFELLLGFKDAENVIFKSEIAEWEKQFPVIVTVDTPSGAADEKTGLVTQYVSGLKTIKQDMNSVEIVIVGPPRMMEFTAKEFIKNGVPPEKIWVSFERRMSCAVGKCGHCRIDEVYVCLEGPVFNYAATAHLFD